MKFAKHWWAQQGAHLHPRKLITALAMAVLLLTGTGVSFGHFMEGDRVEAALENTVLNGKAAASFSDIYSRELPFRNFAIDLWGVISYGVFGDGRPGVIIGKDDWLFTAEEFEAHPDAAAALEQKLTYIEAVREVLADQGGELVIALIPAKTRVYPDQLGRRKPPSSLRSRYATTLAALRARGIQAPNLLTPLQEARKTDQVFLRTDTHWTPVGAQVVADAIAAAVDHVELEEKSFEPITEATIAHKGDLMRYIRLGVFENAMGPKPETIAPLIAEGGEGGGLFGDSEIPVALVGTSYSANELWDFAAALKIALQADVLNVADEGAGPIGPMGAYLTGDDFLENPPSLVVWEIPERFLGVTYPDGEFGLPPEAPQS